MKKLALAGLAGALLVSSCAHMVVGTYQKPVAQEEHDNILRKYQVDMAEVNRMFEEVTAKAEKRVGLIRSIAYTPPLAFIPIAGPLAGIAYVEHVKSQVRKDVEEGRTVRIKKLHEEPVKVERCTFRLEVTQSPEIEKVVFGKVGFNRALKEAGIVIDEKEQSQVLRLHYIKQKVLHTEPYGTHAVLMEASKDGKPLKAIIMAGTFVSADTLAYGPAFKEMASVCKSPAKQEKQTE